jgi:hypothetical protein
MTVGRRTGHNNAGNVTNVPNTSLTYNRTGQLATVTSAGIHQYDQNRHLLEETDGQGNPLAVKNRRQLGGELHREPAKQDLLVLVGETQEDIRRDRGVQSIEDRDGSFPASLQRMV